MLTKYTFFNTLYARKVLTKGKLNAIRHSLPVNLWVMFFTVVYYAFSQNLYTVQITYLLYS